MNNFNFSNYRKSFSPHKTTTVEDNKTIIFHDEFVKQLTNNTQNKNLKEQMFFVNSSIFFKLFFRSK